MLNLDELKFDEKGLIPAIVVDAESKKVLTLAYMNRESLEISIKKELTCFYSRSRQELWLKGETSGNYQHIVSITADCDMDALVVKVEKAKTKVIYRNVETRPDGTKIDRSVESSASDTRPPKAGMRSAPRSRV